MAQNRAPAQKVLRSALANKRVADNVNQQLSGWWQPAMIIATSTSQTVDFGALAIGDIVAHIPAVAGSSSFRSITTAGSYGAAAVVGDLYIVHRLGNLDADNFQLPALI